MSAVVMRVSSRSERRRRSVFVGGVIGALLALLLALPALAQPASSGGFTTDGTAQPTPVAPGASVTVTAAVTSEAATNVLVDVEIYGPSGAKVHQSVFDNQSFAAGQTRSFAVTWSVPANEPQGTHTLRVGIFGVGWGPLRHWNNSAAIFNVATTSQSRVDVMPLGDSLTDGYNIPGGYRIELAPKFASAGPAVDFVGSLANGPASLTDRDHEGHSGWRIDQIAGSVVAWTSTFQPDIVLLMIGTNDVVQDYQLATAPDRLSALIDQIVATVPTTRVIVASIPRIGGSADQQRVQAYNAAIPGIVDTKIAEGKRVSFVDMYSVIGVSDLHTDYTHLNATGNRKLADAWYPAVRSALGLGAPPADTTPPTVTAVSPPSGATSVATQTNVAVTFSEPVDLATLTATTLHLRDSRGSLVPAKLTYNSASRTATLDPNNSLAYSSTYTVRLEGGQSGAVVKDVAGNALAADISWTFKTRRR